MSTPPRVPAIVPSHATLLALARTRRTQRALAHAYLHRHAPMPTLRSSLGFMIGTACTAEEGASTSHSMSVLGVAASEGVAYVLEELDEDDAPILYRLYLQGPRQGHLVPLHSWYEPVTSSVEIRARIAAIAPTLTPLELSTPDAWMLSTRVVQRRALRVTAGPNEPFLRKFALQLQVESVTGAGPSGKTTVTAYLRPGAQLREVTLLPSGDAIARVAYTGIPSGLGQSKETVVLLCGVRS